MSDFMKFFGMGIQFECPFLYISVSITNAGNMKFRTEIFPDNSKFPIEHSEKILTIGSCFAENIAEYFRYYRFNIDSNLFGVLYNPVSILNSLKILNEEKVFSEADLIYDQGEWHSFYHHSDFSHHDKQECLDKINFKIESASQFIKKSDRIIITYGTSFVYNYIQKAMIVSNCHKIPQSEFTRLLLNADEVTDLISHTIDLLSEMNPGLNIIFTVSPVRHWKDGPVENQVSKSQLILAVNRVVEDHDHCEYFPSYEIMMDDLRDYRFYNEDLLHPNSIAIDYIWDKFAGSMLSESTRKLLFEIEKLVKARKHRIRNPDSETTLRFAESNLDLINDLEEMAPYINLTDERRLLFSTS